MVVDGMATALPFHRLIVRDPSFVEEPFRVHTRWIETEWDNTVAAVRRRRCRRATRRASGRPSWSRSAASGWRCRCRPRSAPSGRRRAGQGWRAQRSGRKGHAAAASGDALTSPMQGTIVKVAVAEGDTVAEGDLIVVLEAMKMEQPLNAHKAGVVTGLTAEVGAAVTSGAAICDIV